MKGQAEIIGVAIVALLVISLIIVIRPQPGLVVQQEEEITALATLLKATVRCERATVQMSDLIRSCIEENCSCRDSSISAFLLGLFNGRNYDFEVVKNDITVFREQRAECKKKSIWLPSEERIEVRLGIC